MTAVLTVSALIAISNAQSRNPTPPTGRYPEKYNLIDANPSCRYDIPAGVCCIGSSTSNYHGPQCPGMYQGAGDVDVMAVHPNIKERTEYFMRDFAYVSLICINPHHINTHIRHINTHVYRRMQPFYYNASQFGFNGPYKDECHNGPSSNAGIIRKPGYFMSEGCQAGRWGSYSGATDYSGCSKSGCGQTSHFTCCNYCEYNVWGQCGYKYRSKAFVQLLFQKNAWNDVGGEGMYAYVYLHHKNACSSFVHP